MSEQPAGACRGFVIGALIIIPVYGGMAWFVQLASQDMPVHLTYWQALLLLLALGAMIGGLIALLGLREKVRTP